MRDFELIKKLKIKGNRGIEGNNKNWILRIDGGKEMVNIEKHII
jgi:hypothetical protein